MPFKRADIVTYSEIIETFQIGNMGDMRHSRATNSLVLISDPTKPVYEDKWFGDVLHYTGMGKSGDQSLEFMENKTLAQSNINGIQVHLFEVLIPMQYIYHGIVVLAGDPYQELQNGEDGSLRKVWMFPLKTIQEIEMTPGEVRDKNLEDKEKLSKTPRMKK